MDGSGYAKTERGADFAPAALICDERGGGVRRRHSSLGRNAPRRHRRCAWRGCRAALVMAHRQRCVRQQQSATRQKSIARRRVSRNSRRCCMPTRVQQCRTESETPGGLRSDLGKKTTNVISLRRLAGSDQNRSGRTSMTPESETSWTSPPKLSARCASSPQAIGNRGRTMLNRSSTAARMSSGTASST